MIPVNVSDVRDILLDLMLDLPESERSERLATSWAMQIVERLESAGYTVGIVDNQTHSD